MVTRITPMTLVSTTLCTSSGVSVVGASGRLGIAQPPLSRAITQLERQLGVTLLQRTSRRVALTAAGAVLLSEGRTILGAVAAAERRTQRAAADHPSLVLATKAGASGELLAKLLAPM